MRYKWHRSLQRRVFADPLGFAKTSITYSVPDLVSERIKGLFWGESTGRTPVQGKGTASFRQKTRDKKHTRMYAFYRVLKELQARRSNSEPLSIILKMEEE